MKVTTLIAVTAGGSVADALASLAAQSYGQWNAVIVACGGASADLETQVRHFAPGRPPIHFERLGSTATLVDARNRLLELADGEAIALLEPGDTWHPRHLASGVAALATGVDAALAHVRRLDAGGHPGAEIALPAALASNTTRTLFTRDAVPTGSCVMLRRSVAAAAAPFDSQLPRTAVRDFLLRCAVSGAHFALTRRATCHVPAAPRADRASALEIAEEHTLFYEKHRDLAAVPAALRRRLLAGSLVAQGRLLRPVDPNRAARCFWRAWSLQPVHVQTLGQFVLTGSFAPPPSGEDRP